MTTLAVRRQSAPRADAPEGARRATRVVVAALGALVGATMVVWSVSFSGGRHGGTVLVALSVLLLLLGGGLAPPAMGLVLGVIAARPETSRGRPPGPLLRRIAPAWPWLLGSAFVGYLGLMPRMLLAHVWGVASETLVIVLGTVAFTGFGFALAAARAHDRWQTGTGSPT